MKTRLGSIWVAALALSAISATVQASTPLGTSFTYQGAMTDGGVPANGEYDFDVHLWDMDVGGIDLGADTVCDLDVVDGLFFAELDYGDVFTGNTLWLEVRVRLSSGVGCAGGGYTILAPRQKLTATPYALGIRLPLSQEVNTSSDAISIIQGVTGTGDVAQFEITNPANVGEIFEGHSNGGGDVFQGFNTGTGRAAYLQTTNAANAAVTLEIDAEGSGDGLDIQHDGTGNAFDVVINDTLSTGDAVQAGTNGLGRAATFNLANTASSAHSVEIDSNGNASGDALNVVHAGLGDCGYFEITNSASGGEAVEGRTNGSGDAVQAVNTGTGRGGYFQSTEGDGAVGVSTSGFLKSGVYGETSDPDGFGVYGRHAPTGNIGYLGYERFGAYGYVQENGGAAWAVGLLGDSLLGYGVYGSISSSNEWAGYFAGKVEVTGDLIKPAGSFKIDHPLDPENKFLFHSFVESPDMKNIYDGVVVTDEVGVAVIQLPDWFQALNRDFRYQLTVLDEADGEEWVFARIIRKIDDNQFTIRTSAPNVEVSWQVTGIRQDRYAEAHRIVVEQDKPDNQRGRYLHPDLYGRPIEEQIGRIAPLRPDQLPAAVRQGEEP